MSGRLEGQVAIVTGAGRGFGAAIARAFAAEGAAVALIARRKDEVDAVARALKAAGGRALAIKADVTDVKDVARAVAATEKRFGPVTGLVNNAGRGGPYGPVGTFDPEDWWASLEVHLKAPMMWMNAVLPGMRARKAGRIINVASLAGRQRIANMTAYCVGKGAQIQLTEHAALEVAEDGISTFAINPGLAFTEMAQHTLASPEAHEHSPAIIEFLEKRKAMANSEEAFERCAEMCVDLASGRCDRLTGRFLLVEEDRDQLMADLPEEPSQTSALQHARAMRPPPAAE